MSRNHYNIGPTRTAGPDRCGFCEQPWPCHGFTLEELDARRASQAARLGARLQADREGMSDVSLHDPDIRRLLKQALQYAGGSRLASDKIREIIALLAAVGVIRQEEPD